MRAFLLYIEMLCPKSRKHQESNVLHRSLHVLLSRFSVIILLLGNLVSKNTNFRDKFIVKLEPRVMSASWISELKQR